MVLALILTVLVWFSLTQLITRYGRIPLIASFPLAFAGWIALESLLLNVLSAFNAVDRMGIVYAHLFYLCCWLWVVIRGPRTALISHAKHYATLLRRIRRPHVYLVLFPLVLLLALAAWCYPPNTYDSMVYHMARVAHWLQNQSIEYYPTAIDRQNFMSPGAEYLVLFFQALTNSDGIANFVQFIAYLCLVLSSVYLLRILRIPRGWIPWIVIFLATTPMALMQASSTKNDLVAALMCIAIFIAGRRVFCGDIRKIHLRDYVFLGLAIGAGMVVKPTSLLAALPPLAVVAIIQSCRVVTDLQFIKRAVVGILLLVAVIALINVPDGVRKFSHHIDRSEVYPLFSQYDTDRLWNPLRGVAQNIPFRNEYKELLRNLGYRGPLSTHSVISAQEDSVGNPYQMLLFCFLTCITLAALPLVFFRKRLWIPWVVACSPVVSWVVFGLMIRDQAWLTRLQLPLFFLLPLSFAFLGRLAKHSFSVRSTILALLAVNAIISLGYAYVVAVRVPPRQLILENFWGRKSDADGYYMTVPGMKKEHDILLSRAKEENCSRIGLILGGDSIDYPLTWQAMLQGKEAKHLRSHFDTSDQERRERLDWPCIIYAADGVPEHVPNRGVRWIDIGDAHTYVRNLAYDFEQTETVVFRMENLLRLEQTMQQLAIDSPDGSHIHLQVSGDDPFIILPEIDIPDKGQVVLHVVINSPVETALALYFREDPGHEYSEKNKYYKKLDKGENSMYFLIPSIYLGGQLRFDPSAAEGTFILHKFEIRTLHSTH